MFKTISAGIIVFGGGYLGQLASSAFSVRVSQLEQLRLILTQISFNISFLKMPVTQALTNAAMTRVGTVQKIFVYASEEMSKEYTTPTIALENALDKNRDLLCLNKDDVNILREFALNLGSGDTDYELNNINTACAKLKLAQDMAEADRDRKGKLWRGIGLLCGMLGAILLI